MRIKITKGGIFGGTGELEIGSEHVVQAAPKGWDGRYEIISGNPAPEAVPVTNTAEPDPEPEDEPAAPRRGRPRKEASE